MPWGGWQSFLVRYWEKEPVVLKDAIPAPLASPEEIFALILSAFEAHGKESHSHIRFYAGRRCVCSGFEHFTTKEDTSLESYGRRLAKLTKEEGFGLVINSAQIYHAGIWTRARSFLRGLYQLIGIPVHVPEVVLFFGHYKSTPFGVHNDNEGVFSFTIQGEKKIRVWPPGAYRGRLNAAEYQDALEGSIALGGSVNDVLYWPGSHDHVGEGVGLCVSLNIRAIGPKAVYNALSGPLEPILREALSEASKTRLLSFDPSDLQESAARLPLAFEQIIEVFARFPTRMLRKALSELWLRRLSAVGFSEVPPPLAEEDLEDEMRVRADPMYPVLWRRSGELLFCAANGLSFDLPAHPNVIQLLMKLNSGDPVLVREVISQHAGAALIEGTDVEIDAAEIRAILRKLYATRAITKI